MSGNASSIDCAWNLVVKAPGGVQKSVITLRSHNGVLTGTIANDAFGTQEIEEGTYDGELLTWKSRLQEPVDLTVSYFATLDDENNISGHIRAAMAKILFSGTPVGK